VRCEHGGPREDFLGGSAEAAGVGDFFGGKNGGPHSFSLWFLQMPRGALLRQPNPQIGLARWWPGGS
jgi:hypothetical protein